MNLFEGRLVRKSLDNHVTIEIDNLCYQDFIEVNDIINDIINDAILDNRIITDKNGMIPGTFRIKIEYEPE